MTIHSTTQTWIIYRSKNGYATMPSLPASKREVQMIDRYASQTLKYDSLSQQNNKKKCVRFSHKLFIHPVYDKEEINEINNELAGKPSRKKQTHTTATDESEQKTRAAEKTTTTPTTTDSSPQETSLTQTKPKPSRSLTCLLVGGVVLVGSMALTILQMNERSF